MLTRIGLWTALALTLDAFQIGWLGTIMIVALFVCADLLSRQEGQQYGAADALSRYLRMTEREQEKVKRMIKEWESK